MAKLDWKKAIVAGIISYAVIFLVISGMMFAPGAYDAATMQWALWSKALTLIVGFVVVWAIATYYYFKAKPSNAVKEGVMLGLVMMIVAFIIEIPVMESGSYLYVCSECGADLTEIPYYNRYYCQNCGLHY